MEKERKIKTLSIVALIVAVLGLTVAFASLSQVLTIRGTTTAKGGKWDIHFEKDGSGATMVKPVKTGEAEATDASLNSTSISGIAVTLKKPGDTVTYEFDVKNAGTINAKIGALTEKKGICESLDGESQENEEMVCSHLVYSLQYKEDSGNKDVKVNDDLNKTDKKTMVLTIAYDGNADEIPSNDVQIEIPDITITYVQK